MLSKDKVLAYLDMAESISKLSPDAETKVGAVMISPNGRVIASSYNGFLRGADDNKLPKTRPEKYKFMQHAERNMIYNCAYEGIRTKDTTIVCTLSPCLDCLKACMQSGVKAIVFREVYHKLNLDVYKNLEDMDVTITTKHMHKTGEILYYTLDLKPIKES